MTLLLAAVDRANTAVSCLGASPGRKTNIILPWYLGIQRFAKRMPDGVFASHARESWFQIQLVACLSPGSPHAEISGIMMAVGDCSVDGVGVCLIKTSKPCMQNTTHSKV